MGRRGRTGEEDRVLEELLVVGAVRAVEELGEGRLNAHREVVRVQSKCEPNRTQIECSKAEHPKVDFALRRLINFGQSHFFQGLSG